MPPLGKLIDTIYKNLEEQANLIFKNWFVDFEPFGKKIPQDWTFNTLESISDNIICGKTPSTKNKAFYGKEIPFITIPDMHNRIYIVETERYLSSLGASSQYKKNLPINTICVSCIGTPGLVSLVSEISQTNQQINSIIPKKNISPYYIYLMMKRLTSKIITLGSSGSTIINLNKTQFSKLKILIPSTKISNNFNQMVEPIFEQILLRQKENIQLIKLRDTILPKLIYGKLDILKIEL